MRRFVAQNKILAVFVSAFLLPILLVAVSESELDDVAAMVTNAKKAPNTIFILDTSESMNSFAYSDYIETCDDALDNAQHALDICNTSKDQCNAIKSDAGCAGGSIDCTNIANACPKLEQSKRNLKEYCDKVAALYQFPGYPYENRRLIESGKTERFVGPWDPNSFYKDDICFYDWTKDTNGDVLNGKTSDNWSNVSQSKTWTYDGVDYYNSDRSSWDCITDGNDKMSNGQTLSSMINGRPEGEQGVSGYWLNWKYATSLDAVKILLADTHQFSNPPRSRGTTACFRYDYKPVGYVLDKECKEYNSEGLCDKYNCEEYSDDGKNCAFDESTGDLKYTKKKICFISPEVDPDVSETGFFDTAYLGEGDNRSKYLTAMQQIISGSWDATKYDTELPDEICAKYDILNDFSFYDNKNSTGLTYDKGISSHPAPVMADAAECEKCMRFNNNVDNPAFLEEDCSEFQTQNDSTIPRKESLGTYSIKYHQECCKTSKCTNPKCRDNDFCCQDNDAAFPNEQIEGYDTCHGYNCALGFYSEFDQDTSHCCNTVACVSGESGLVKEDPDDNGCYSCQTGTVITNETILETPEASVTALPEGFEYPSGINMAVLVKSMSGAESIEDMTVTLYYACNGSDDWNAVAAFTCTYEGNPPSEQPCSYYGDPSNAAENPNYNVIINQPLSGCEEEGYKVKVVVTTTGRYCGNSTMSDQTFAIDLEYKLPDESFAGHDVPRKVFDPTKEYYMNFKREVSSAQSDIVYEYECKNAFYHTQAFSDSSRCPSGTSYSIVNRFHQLGYNDVQYCDPASRRQEVVTQPSGCGFETTYFCTYLCRDEIKYDKPWKCMAWFYQLDEFDRGGLEKCSAECQKDSGISEEDGVNYTEACCRCIDRNYNRYPYTFFEPLDGVTMPDENGNKKLYHCAVSGIMGSDTQVGWHAEIINGHIHEAGQGSYLLQPYITGSDTLYSPYPEEPGTGWISSKTFLTKKTTDTNIMDTKISGFKTTSEADRRNVCIYDLVDEWGGDLCSVCSTCTFGCADDPSIHVADDKCAYPSFWLQVPRSDGGELIFSSEDLQSPESINRFRKTIKGLRAVGGPTLGETLYDAWRFLGGMYALYDQNHSLYDKEGNKLEKEVTVQNEDGTTTTTKVPKNEPYTSPFENMDAACFQNEVIVLSGGQPQFDHNDMVYTKMGRNPDSCPSMGDETSDIPCVKHTEKDYKVNDPVEHRPYYETDWYQTSILNVSHFVKTHSYYNSNADCAHATDLKKNLLGYNPDGSTATKCIPGSEGCTCTGCYCTSGEDTGNDKTVINTIHSGAIGEWTLSELYNKMDFQYLEKITKKYPDTPSNKDKDGQYCSLTLGNDSNDNCIHQNITDVLSNLLTLPQDSDVNSGRPHWTSSLVQPLDVEEKYRGPEAYVAGTVPIAPKKSRFWFGNLKKYMVDEGTSGGCNITISNPEGDSSTCGEWKKQTFTSAADCFVTDDTGTDMTSTSSSIDDFKRLLSGGAAKKLSDKLRTESCSSTPCFKNVSSRKIYYDVDLAGALRPLKSVGSNDFGFLMEGLGDLSQTDAEKIFDYMYGYDAYGPDGTKLRYGYDNSEYGEAFEILDPINIDFSHQSKLNIRPLLLGAIVHSKPLAVYYGTTAETRIFAGANDGMLHAFDGNGNEKWGYIPSNALKSIAAIGTSTTGTIITYNANVDGPITLFHIDSNHDGIINGSEKAYLVFGYRRGASGYTVIDVSDPDSPRFVQNLNVSGGFSFGKAVVFRKCNQTMCSYADQLDYYLAVPGGYDTCADGSDPKCKMPENSADTNDPLLGNKFAIYKFDKEHGKFETAKGKYFNYERDKNGAESDPHKKWLVASFASTPFAINTSGKGAVSTEYVYFTDLTGTVFRVDVRDASMNNWTAKVVFAKRNAAGDAGGVKLWESGKSYVGNNFFPPLEKYSPRNDATRIPIPVVFGDASWPKSAARAASMTVFYDIKSSGTDPNTPYSGYDSSKFETGNLANNNKFHENKSGWRIDFAKRDNTRGEKGITEPMLVYDFYGSKNNEDSGKNGYSLAWNTYIPQKTTECKNFGTSFNYERLVIDGSQAQSLSGMTANTAVGEWNPANCDATSEQGISLATAVGIIATDKGYDLTFGAGADIYRKEEISVLISSTRIIKWYELY